MVFDPTFEVRFLAVSGIFCILLNSLAIYMILFKSGNIGTYRYYLLYFQIVSFIADLHLTLLIAPTVYFPALLGISNGVSPFFIGRNNRFQDIMFTLIVLQVSSLLCSFIRKHQSVAAIGQRNIISPTHQYVIKASLHLPPLLVLVIFGSADLEKDEETALARQQFPRLLPLLALPNSELYSTSSPSLIITLFVMVTTFVAFNAIFLYLFIQIFHMLHGHRKFMSAATYSKQISAVLSLVAQMIVLCIWIVVPIGLLLLDVILRIEGMEAYCNLLICLFSTHSIVSTSVMMVTFPAFRRVIRCQKKQVFSPRATVFQRPFAQTKG